MGDIGMSIYLPFTKAPNIPLPNRLRRDQTEDGNTSFLRDVA
jgi:hypothetical protein